MLKQMILFAEYRALNIRLQEIECIKQLLSPAHLASGLINEFNATIVRQDQYTPDLATLVVGWSDLMHIGYWHLDLYRHA